MTIEELARYLNATVPFPPPPAFPRAGGGGFLALRDDFRSTPQYKLAHRKDSFDGWDLPINTLEAWSVLLPQVAAEFRALRDRRNDAIHFRPDVDANDRALALAAVLSLSAIVGQQFGAFGPQPWFITGVPGEAYLKKDWEDGLSSGGSTCRTPCWSARATWSSRCCRG